MNKSLHTKLVLIILLLIVSLMTVVCIFLIRGVQSFYLNGFYEQMSSVFAGGEFAADLRDAAAQPDAAERLDGIIGSYSGLLGIDSDTRNYYILDGSTGRVLAGSDMTGAQELEITPNILAALDGREGDSGSASDDYMDVAVPLSEGTGYIIYIRDNKETAQDLNMQLFMIIMQSLLFALVISVFLSFLLSKTMVTPIQDLTHAAERVAAGDFSAELDEAQTRDEIGVLTNTFNNMAVQLKDTLEDIENERNKLSTVFRHMADGVVAFSRDGKLIHYNPAAERLLGRQMHTSPPDYRYFFGDVADAEELFELEEMDYVTVNRTIGKRELQIFLATFSGEGAQGGVLAVIHDITEQKKSDDMRREFVANVSHELRTPITNIRSYAETLMEAEDIPADMQKSFLKVILSESDRMTKIVRDLLTLSRFDAGSADVHFEPFSVQDMLREVCAAITLEAAKLGHTLSLHFEGDIPKINGDSSRIEQVIVNIVSNAVKYTPRDGKIEVNCSREGDTVVIAVKDNGIGIPKEDQPRIFERFYRVDKARSRAAGGTGLGLSIAKEIVMSHGGSIDLDSEVGRGTCITVTLPLDAADVKQGGTQ